MLSNRTGKISGLVYDVDTNQPLAGCNVIVKELLTGAATDIDGYFLVMDISPGQYTVIFKMIGYSDYVINNLQINSDLTFHHHILSNP